MKKAIPCSFVALSFLVFTSCTPSETTRAGDSYSSGRSGGGSYFKRSDDSWQDRTFRSGGY